MKRLLLAFAIALAIPASAAKATKATLHVSNVNGWELKMLEDGSLAKQFLGGADAALVRQTTDPKDLGAQAKVFHRGQVSAKDLEDNIKQWREQVFGKYMPQAKALVDRTLRSGNEIRYYAEYQVDEKSETMLHASLVALIVEGELYVIVYEQYPDYYSKNIASVREAFKNLKLTLK